MSKNVIPYSDNLNIGVLSSLFKSVTNSYKYVFFISLLNLLRDRNFDSREPISLDVLFTEMLVTAWYPHSFFRLSFGKQDKIAAVLNSLALSLPDQSVLGRTGRDHLREIFSKRNKDRSFNLVRYVPYRLLRAFLAHEVRGMSDSQVNKQIAALAFSEFETRRPLYRFDESGQNLIFHPAWAEYFCENYSIVLSWASWGWAEYRQSRNPNVPAVTKKLFPPQRRAPLNKQRKYWKFILGRENIRCIYTGELLNSSGGTTDAFAMDHFLPWKFVVHDQLWNLVPVDPKANASKSDRLPSRRYLEDLVFIQHLGMNNTVDTF